MAAVPRSPLASECESIFREALAELSAARLVGEALREEEPPPGPLRVLALGKAAAPMAEAAAPSTTNTTLNPRTNARPWLKVAQRLLTTSPEGATERPPRYPT